MNDRPVLDVIQHGTHREPTPRPYEYLPEGECISTLHHIYDVLRHFDQRRESLSPHDAHNLARKARLALVAAGRIQED